jgi:hypothetical protein
MSGIAKQQRQERILFHMAERGLWASKTKKGKQKVTDRINTTQHGPDATMTSSKDLPSVSFDESELLAYSDPKAHYHIAGSTRYYLNVQQWLGRHADDPALKVFISH